MIQLNRSMMERYEIENSRPENLRAVIFGADYLMLGAVARLMDQCGVGAVCVSRDAENLRTQDCMFTMLVRGEELDGKKIDREQVVQSIISAVNPETEFEDFIKIAGEKPEIIVCHAGCDDVEIALLARLLFECRENMPVVLMADDHPRYESKRHLKDSIALVSRNWASERWLEKLDLRLMLCDGLSAPLDESERAIAFRKMNYRDDFIMWAEPYSAFAVEGGAPECLQAACGDFEKMHLLKTRVFDTAVFLCTAAGYLCGMDTFAQTLKDEKIRAWIGKTFHDELLPHLPAGREEAIISAFERLENPMNRVPLLTVGKHLLGNFDETLLPSIIAFADENFESPEGLSLGLAAAIMLYAGARRNEKGEFTVARNDQSHAISDDPEILEAFSRLAHDMPAESLAYAALADRAIWGRDLRDVDGLEMRVMYELSSIQRIGMKKRLEI